MRRTRFLAAALTIVAAGSVQAQGIPVFDSSSFGQMVLTVKTLGDQVRQLEAVYSSLNGTRGLGGVFYNPALRQYLPEEWGRVYDAAASGSYAGISGSLRAIRASEELKGSVDESLGAIRQRSRAAPVTDKAVGMRAFEGEKERLRQIEQLMGQINRTRDAKGMQEVQARLAVEQAAVANEATKLQLVSMLQRVEERLVEQQKSDVAQRILSASNRGMPACCSSRLPLH